MKRRLLAEILAITLLASTIFAGCGSSSGQAASTASTVSANASAQASGQEASDSTAKASDESTAASDAAASDSSSAAESAQSGSTLTTVSADSSDIFTDRDLRQSADTSEAVTLTVSDGEDITISEEGVYVITGTASNCTIRVEAADDAKIQIVLDNVTIANESAPAIYVVSAKKVFVTTAEGTANTLTVSGVFTSDGTTNTDAVIFAKDDLVLNGLGTLVISSSDNGISAKDDLKITGGTYEITAASDAIETNDSISICDGTFTINCEKDGLHCENDDDNTQGSVYISGGSFTINAGDDCIQATTTLVVDGGTFTLNGRECLEATDITINDGTIAIESSDDGINASQKSTALDVVVKINGGDITINMGQGDTDGIDSNGSLYINGGTLNINAQSPFDYDQEGVLSENATVYVNGQQVTELTNQMMGGMGGMGGFGGQRGNMGGNASGTTDGSTQPGQPEGGFGGGPGGHGKHGSQSQDGSFSGEMPEGFDGQTPPEGGPGEFGGQMPEGGFGGPGSENTTESSTTTAV